MEEELKNLIKVCVSVTSALSYCYFSSARTKAGVSRLISVLPVCAIFYVLPLFFSSSTFCSYTAFYLSLANFKLILFSFDQGPLFPLPPNLSQFIAFTCFPIKLQQSPKPLTHFPKWFFTIKVALFIVVLHVYDYLQYLPSISILGLYPLHTYLEHEIVLTLLKYIVMATLGRELQQQFNEPYLATSLQDFWGRRWNLMVSDILRSGIYYPVRKICQRFVNSEWASIIGVLATFIASGVAHEVLYVYLTREPPTGEVTWFFVLHGVCTVVEVLVKKKTFVGQMPVRPIVSRLLTVGFVCLTSGWLFYPQLIRSNVMDRHAYEASLFLDLLKRKLYFSW